MKANLKIVTVIEHHQLPTVHYIRNQHLFFFSVLLVTNGKER